MIADIENLDYTGAAHEPDILVRDGEPSAIKVSDYEVSYENNKNAGEGKVIITATETGNYSGEAETTFDINKRLLKDAMLEPIEDLIYNGAKREPEVLFVPSEAGIILESDYVVTYKANRNAGTAKVIVTAKKEGNYTGECVAEFIIHQKELNTDMVPDIKDLVYNGKEQKPEVILTDGEPSIIEESDYIITYENNENAGSAKAVITAVTDGNYKGSVRKDFIILKKNQAVLSSSYHGIYDGNSHSILVKVEEGVVYYRISTKNMALQMSAEDYKKEAPRFTESGEYAVDFMVVRDNHNDFYGTETVKIEKKPITNTMFAAIASQTYTGKEIRPTILVTDFLLSGNDYDVEYRNNIKTGKAQVIIIAKEGSNFTGSIIMEFEIVKEKVQEVKPPQTPEAGPLQSPGVDKSVNSGDNAKWLILLVVLFISGVVILNSFRKRK